MKKKPDLHLTNLLDSEIESSTQLLDKLRLAFHNSQPELTGKLRLREWKASGNSQYTSFEFIVRESDSRTKKYQTKYPLKNIGNKLKRGGLFAENYESAKGILESIVEVINYRNKLIALRIEITQRVTATLRENVNLLARNKTKAKQFDDLIYENLKSRGLENLYNHTEL